MSAGTPAVSRRAVASRKRTGLSPMANVLVRLAAPVAILVIWEVWTQSAKNLFFPPPSAIAVRMWELWLSGAWPWIVTAEVSDEVIPSLLRMLAGFAIAAVLGIAVGTVIGRSQRVSWTVEPLLHFLRSVPGPALLPVFMVLFGTDATMRVALIAFGSVWPIILNTIDGVREVEPTQLETAKTFGLPLRARLSKIILPSAGPKVFAGLAVALAIALVLMVISELTVATNGIGYEIQRAQQTFAMTDMWAWIALVALLGWVLNVLFTTAERRVLRWHRGARRHDD